MEFCPKCGSVIMGRNCARCDYISEEDIKQWENELGLPIELTSAKTAENVSNVFEKLAKTLLNKYLNQKRRKAC